MNTIHTFCAWLRRTGNALSQSVPADGFRDIFAGGRIGELLSEREELAEQIETLTRKNNRLTKCLESSARKVARRDEDIAQHERMGDYRSQEISRLRAEVSHYKKELADVAPLEERARNKRLDHLAALAAKARTGAPHPLN